MKYSYVSLIPLALLMLISTSLIGKNSVKVDASHVEQDTKKLLELNPKDFPNSTKIDNVWWPLMPGTKHVYEGFTDVDGERKPHRIEFIVTDMTKVVGDVRTRVIYDVDYSDGEIVEMELAFFAQDKLGNVWHLGQYSEVYEDEFVGGRIWYVGNPKGAKAGIMVPGIPKLGSPSFSQGYAPSPFNWTDRGRVSQVGLTANVPAGKFKDVIVIDEFDAEHPGTFQLKYYAPGVGSVQVGWRGKTDETETLELVKIEKLSSKELKKVRATVQDIETRAKMYSELPPAE